MRLTLIHNPTAGSGRPSGDELVSWLRAVGYDVRYQSTKADGVEHALDDPGDLVLVAGGDGAVADVAKRLVGRGTPLGILPIGTANNIAHSLGVHGSPRELVDALRPERLPRAQHAALTVGVARAPWGESRFVEAAGVGLFTALLRDADRAKHKRRRANTAGRTDKVEQGRRRLRRVFDSALARRRLVEADGEDLSGNYLMAEVLIVPSIGPRVTLAPQAGRGDGYLSLVLLPEVDRAAFGEYLTALAGRRDAVSPLAVRRVRRACLSWEPGDGHLDDEPWPRASAAPSDVGDPSYAKVEIAILDPPLDVFTVRG